MKSLEAIQNMFYQTMLSQQSATNFITSTHPDARLNVYRQTIRDTMRKALALTFPGVWQLLGEECANAAAHRYCQQEINLPKTGCLDDWGHQFPNFLGQQPELKALDYLQDYAYYEWLKHQSYIAKSASPMNADALRSIPEDIIEKVVVSFLPSVFFYESNHPLDEIDTLIENPDNESIKLTQNKSYAIIARPENSVLTFWVAVDMWAFTHSLWQGKNLAQSVETVLEFYPDFDLTTGIQFMFANQLIANVI